MDPAPRSSRTSLRIAVVVIIAAVTAGAIWLIERPTPVAPGILFVGDSVTYLSTSALDDEMRSDDPQVVARIGFRSSEMLPLFEREVLRRKQMGDEHLQQVAILIGYNDVLQDKVGEADIDRFMDAAERFECAVWLELPPVPMHDDDVAVWNRQVATAARSHPNVHVIDDWRNAVMRAKPGELITRKDGVHPTKAGAARLAQIYTDGVHRVC